MDRGPMARGNDAAPRGPGVSRAGRLGLLALVLAVAAPWVLANLGSGRLWQDEAQTALIAGTVLTHGVPPGHDDRNSFSQDYGKDYGPGYVWLWHPWLPFYVLAGFFAVLGTSTFVARLPFALAGIVAILLAATMAARWGRSRRAGLFAAVLLLLDVPFLILVRQSQSRSTPRTPRTRTARSWISTCSAPRRRTR
jgi:4-amino-4-deoxy-L-arabinose transferase-like glycosyltransferase